LQRQPFNAEPRPKGRGRQDDDAIPAAINLREYGGTLPRLARGSAAFSEIPTSAASWLPVANDPSGGEFEAIGLTLPTSPQRSD